MADGHIITARSENEIFRKFNFLTKSFSEGVVEMCQTAKIKISYFFKEEKEDFEFFSGSAYILAHVPKIIISMLYKLRDIFTKSCNHQKGLLAPSYIVHCLCCCSSCTLLEDILKLPHP